MKNWLKYALLSLPLVGIFSAKHLHKEATEMTEEERKKLGRQIGWTAILMFIVGAGGIITILALGVANGSWSLTEAAPMMFGVLVVGGCMVALARI